MKNTIKKALSILLALVIMATAVPLTTLAAEDNAENDHTVTADMGDMSMTATNSFGEMLTDSLSERTEEQNTGYYISDIEYEGHCALVSFVTQQDCTIRVAVYEEDTGRMVTTASADVLATDMEAIVEFEDELPEYFVLKAFMVDEDIAPLCKAYTCNEMTQVYEDFMVTTVEDYPEDKVINLDEDETTNFLVMSDEASTVINNGKTNVLASYDSEKGVYTFDNIDNQIKSLKKDDIFYFDNGNLEELTFIKVGEIEINGTTAYITEAETSIEEVFDIVKIDNEMTSGEFSLNENEELEDGVTYIGCEEVEESLDEVSTFGWGNETSVTFKHNFQLKKEIKPKEPSKISNNVSMTGKISISGTAGVTVRGTFQYYISKEFSEIEFTITPSIGLNISLEGVGRIEIKLKSFDISPCAGVYVGISPKIIMEASVKASFDATLKFTVGFGYNSKDGLVNKTKKPSFKPEFKIEGEVFVGVDLAPNVSVISKKILKFELGTEIGAKLTAEMSTNQDEMHVCDSCLDGDIDLVGSLSGSIVFGEGTKWKKNLTITFLNIKIDIVSFYFSFTYADFGWGVCPYVNGNTGSGGNSGNSGGSEDDSGETIYDCSTMGHYYESTAIKMQTCTEYGEWKHVCIYCNDTYYEEVPAYGHNFWGGVCSFCSLPGGSCGENLLWMFYIETGTLIISGTGKMYDFGYENQPWESYCNNIKKTVIEKGVTSIGRSAFSDCISLKSITIPDSVTSIDVNAFYNTAYYNDIKNWANNVLYIDNHLIEAKKNISGYYEIKNGTLTIADYAFSECNILTSITIPDSVITIGDGAFYCCESLSNVIIGDGVVSIGHDAFSCCWNLESVKIGNSVISIGRSAFSDCISLESITIPDNVTTIDECAFKYCYKLTSVIIPDNVISIGNGAFSGCDSLTNITVNSNNQYYSSDEYGVLFNKEKTTLIQYPVGNTRTNYIIPNTVTLIGDYAFYWCDSLTNITIPDGVTSIGYLAFCDCKKLLDITLPDSLISIGEGAFSNCNSLTIVIIPSSVTSIGYGPFSSCDSLTNIIVDSNNHLYLVDESGALFNKDKTTLIQYPVGNNITSYILPDSVTTIGDGAFESCTSLTSITIGDSVTTIGDCAFDYCHNLTDVYYDSTAEQWNKISISYGNECLTNATIHYNSTGVIYSLKSNSIDLLSFATTNSSDVNVYKAIAENTIIENEYFILVLKNDADINNYTNDDILYIDQKSAEADKITFNYVPKTDDECIVYIIGVFADSDKVKQEIITSEEICNHSYIAVVISPTCITGGYTTYTCSACGDTYKTDEVSALGHSFENGTCKVCGEKDPSYTDEPEYNYSFYIKSPSRTEIRNRDEIVLHAIIDGNAPEGSYIKWSGSNGNFSFGYKNGNYANMYAEAEDKGWTTITATLYDANGNELAHDSVEMYSKSGFFDKIGGFFRSLFGTTKTYDE